MSQNDGLDLKVSGGEVVLAVGGSPVIVHTPQAPFVEVGHGEPRFRSRHGNFTIRSGLRWRKPLARAEVVSREPGRAEVRFAGADGTAVRLIVEATAVGGTLSATDTGGGGRRSGAAVRCTLKHEGGPAHDRVRLRLPAGGNESTYGCGEQFSRFDLRGSRLPLWVSEQGVGRGFNLTTLAANIHSGAGGHWHSTYFPQPTYVTETGRLVHLETDAYARFDFAGPRDILDVWQPEFSFVLGVETTLEAAVCALSDLLGRQPPLPPWTDDGMWLGLQGGSGVVREKVARARDAGIPLSAVWVQDWVGRRVTAFGSQLFWDWKYDTKLYPDLPQLIEELRADGIRFLGYINPFLAIEGDLYKEASARGYCVKNRDGSDYLITVTSFPAAKFDLTNPEAFDWCKRIIRENMLGVGLSGWMADYGEYLPTDAVLADGPADRFHNRYPAEWARLNYEATSEAGKLDDTAIFMRAGYTGSSRYTHAIWAGDQMVDWSRHDGLPSVIPAALSAGVVGVGVSHSDIGGFTSLFGKRRPKELLLRWAELAAFTPIMRSHESNRPGENHQWDTDDETVRGIAASARVFVALAPYRRAVLDEYYSCGLPVMRPVPMHYRPTTENRNSYRYLLGRDVLVAPVLRAGVGRATVPLPDDDWVHIWSGRRFSGGVATVDAPIGRPPVFYRASTRFAETMSAAAAAAAAVTGDRADGRPGGGT